MEADEPVTVYTVNNPYQAEIIRMALEGEGIVCQLDGKGQAGLSDILEIGILVRARDADRARRIIRHNEAKHQDATPQQHDENHHPEDVSEVCRGMNGARPNNRKVNPETTLPVEEVQWKSSIERGAADCSSGNRFPAEANGPPTAIGGSGSQWRHSVDHAARGLVAGREGPGPERGAAQVQEFHRQLFTNSADELRQEINESPGSKSAKRPRKWKPRQAPWCRSSRPARWCRCCSHRVYLRTVGAGTERITRKKGRFAMLVLSRTNQESVVVGGADGIHRLFKSRCWRFTART